MGSGKKIANQGDLASFLGWLEQFCPVCAVYEEPGCTMLYILLAPCTRDFCMGWAGWGEGTYNSDVYSGRSYLTVVL